MVCILRLSNDIISSLIGIGRYILEGLDVALVSQDVIRVNTLQVVLWVLELVVLDLVNLIVHGGVHTVLSHVILFGHGPTSVIVIETLVVDLDLLVDLEALEHVVTEVSHEELSDRILEKEIDAISVEENNQNSSWSRIEDCHWVHTSIPVVLSDKCVTLMIFWRQCVTLKLQVAKHPVAETEEEAWRVGHGVESVIIQLLIVGRRRLVAEVHHELFQQVDHNVRARSSREEDWEAGTVHHGDEGDVKQARVLVVHVVLGTSVQVDVLLDGHGGGLLAFRGEAPVLESVCSSQSLVHQVVGDGVPEIELHGRHQTISHVEVPAWVEVRITTVKDALQDRELSREVGIDQQKEETSIKELA